jgi:nitrite reductase (NADH) small subunit/3-phenylpropionate/trans-cinnamate dioxygenase ferredoxin subunit
MGNFTTVARVAQLPPGGCMKIDSSGKKIALFNVDGRFCALEDNCNHRGGPLSEGELDGQIVTCPWHGARFDVTTGEPKGPPANMPMKTYTVQVVGDEVQVEM